MTLDQWAEDRKSLDPEAPRYAIFLEDPADVDEARDDGDRLVLDQHSLEPGESDWMRFFDQSADPNAKYVCDNGSMFVVTTREIQPREPITVDYDWDEAYVTGFTDYPQYDLAILAGPVSVPTVNSVELETKATDDLAYTRLPGLNDNKSTSNKARTRWGRQRRERRKARQRSRRSQPQHHKQPAQTLPDNWGSTKHRARVRHHGTWTRARNGGPLTVMNRACHFQSLDQPYTTTNTRRDSRKGPTWQAAVLAASWIAAALLLALGPVQQPVLPALTVMVGSIGLWGADLLVDVGAPAMSPHRGEALAADLDSRGRTRGLLYLDSGATIHLDPVADGMSDYRPASGITITTAQSGAGLPVVGLGTRRQGSLKLQRVHHAPGASKRLASLGEICDTRAGYQVLFDADGFQVRSTPCTCNAKIEALGFRETKPDGKRGMYAFATPTTTGGVVAPVDTEPAERKEGETTEDSNARTTKKDRKRRTNWNADPNTSTDDRGKAAFEGATASSTKWTGLQMNPTEKIGPTRGVIDLHASLAHTNLERMKLMTRSGMLPIDKKTQGHLALVTHLDCESCLAGKATRKSAEFRKPWNNPAETRPGAKLMCDIRGPYAVESKAKKKYFLDIVDQASHFVAAIGLRTKDEAQEALREYITFCEKQYNTTVVTVQSDNDGAIVDQPTLSWLQKKGIKYTPSPPHTKELNGAPERDHRTINEAVHTLLHQSGLGPSYWELALHHFVYVKNRTAHNMLPPTTNPCTVMRRCRVRHQPFVPFGCKVTAYIHPALRAKDDQRVEENMIVVGYAPKGAYKCLRKNGSIVNRSFEACTFFPNVFPRVMADDSSSDDQDDSPNDDNHATRKSEEGEKQSERPFVPVRRSTRQRAQPLRMSDTHFPTSKRDEQNYISNLRSPEEVNAVERMATESTSREQCCAALAAINRENPDPSTYVEAVSGPDREHWIAAIEEELASHRTNNTWTACEKPTKKKVIGCKWVFKLKRDQHGRPTRYKARLTAKGYSQTHGIDYDETFAPTVRFTSIRIFFALCASFGWKMKQLDVKTAYLIPELKETIFMKTPEGFHHHGAVRLNKSLYGLKQAGREWNHNLHNTLTKASLKRSAFDPCLYEHFDSSGKLLALVVVYVDDILIGGDAKTVAHLSDQLTSTYKMTSGPVEHFLGMKVRRTPQGTIEISQGAYTRRLLERFAMVDCAAAPTPAMEERLSTKDQPSSTEEREAMRGVPYRECVGALQYLAVLTRPDIVFAVNQASRFLSNPGPKHWTAVKRILRYLRGTPDDGLRYVRSEDAGTLVDGFSDSDWAGDRDDRRSCSGHIFRVFGGIVAFRSKKQPTTALSSCEAELIALTMAMKEALWLRGLLVELGIHQPTEPVLIHEDNQGAKALANDAKFSDRTKHVDIKFFRVREEVKRNHIKVAYCHTSKMIADIFTKPLGKNVFQTIRNQLGMLSNGPSQPGHHPV
jgi:hypothetical protein